MPRRHKKLKVLHQRCVHQFPMWLSGLSIPTIWSCLKQDLVSCLRRLESEIGPSTKSPPQQAHHQTESKLQFLEGPDVAFEIMRKTETSAQVMENDRNWWGFLFRNWCYAEVPQLAQLPMISMLPLPCDLNKLWSSWRKHADFRSEQVWASEKGAKTLWVVQLEFKIATEGRSCGCKETAITPLKDLKRTYGRVQCLPS